MIRSANVLENIECIQTAFRRSAQYRMGVLRGALAFSQAVALQHQQRDKKYDAERSCHRQKKVLGSLGVDLGQRFFFGNPDDDGERERQQLARAIHAPNVVKWIVADRVAGLLRTDRLQPTRIALLPAGENLIPDTPRTKYAIGSDDADE